MLAGFRVRPFYVQGGTKSSLSETSTMGRSLAASSLAGRSIQASAAPSYLQRIVSQLGSHYPHFLTCRRRRMARCRMCSCRRRSGGSRGRGRSRPCPGGWGDWLIKNKRKFLYRLAAEIDEREGPYVHISLTLI